MKLTDADVFISMSDRMSRAELTAAIETLTAIRDAMENNA